MHPGEANTATEASNPCLARVELKILAEVAHRLYDLWVLLDAGIGRFSVHEPLKREVCEVDEFAHLSRK